MWSMKGDFIFFRELDRQSRLRGANLRSKAENEWEELTVYLIDYNWLQDSS